MYHMILIPLVALITAQILKLIIDAVKGKFSWKDMSSYGGLPSAHTSFVLSLAGAVGYFEGWDSAGFAISAVLAVIVIGDALGFRRELGKHAIVINTQIKQLAGKQNYGFEHLVERLGHSWPEVCAGAVTAILVTFIYILIAT